MRRLLALTCCFLLIASPALGAVAAEGTVTFSEAASAAGLTYARTTSGSDRLLVVCVEISNLEVTSTGVTYNAVAMTLVDRQVGVDQVVEMWRLIAPATGANDVAITLSGTADRVISGALHFTGVHQTVPVGTAAKATDNSDTISVNVNSASGELIVDCAGSRENGETFTAGAGQTELLDELDAGVRWIGASTEAGDTTVTMSWSIGAGWAWATVAAPLKPASAAATPVRRRVIVVE